MSEIISGSLNFTGEIDSSAISGMALQEAEVNLNDLNKYRNGTGNGQVDRAISLSGTLVALASVDFDLDSGALLGPLGTAQTFAKVQALIIYNDGTGDLVVSGDFLGLSVESISVPAKGKLALEYGTAGRNVVAVTGDVITLYSMAGTKYRIAVQGRSV